MGGAAYAWAPFAYPSGPVHAAVFLAAALLVIASRRIADHLWDATAGAPLVTGPPVLAALARYPFRLLGGGAAFTVAMLSAKRAEVLWVNDVPVINIFTAGAILAAVYNAVRDAVPGPPAP